MRTDYTGHKETFSSELSALNLDCDDSYRSKFTKTIHLITGECYL